MQKNKKLLVILIGTLLLVLMIATGTSASPMVSGAEVFASPPFLSQFPAGSAGVSCSACHAANASLEGLTRSSIDNQPIYLNLYSQILSAHTTSPMDDSNLNLNLSQESIYTILTQSPEQSIRLENYSDPIVQCSFCHTGELELAYLPMDETD